MPEGPICIFSFFFWKRSILKLNRFKTNFNFSNGIKYFSGIVLIGSYPISPSNSTDNRPQSFEVDNLENLIMQIGSSGTKYSLY